MRHILLSLALLTLAACGGDAADTPTTPDTTGEANAKPADDASTQTKAKKPARPRPPKTPPTVTATWRGEGEALEFNAWKMGCSGCESTIKKRINEIDGVAEVEADMASTEVRVKLDDAKKRDAVIAQITKVLETPESGRKFEIVRAKE
ncbi:MAG: heavy-metal-associated domain-containing protein [Planctomycetota bacterium]|nr:heavy-metal-associated domain-containing protein [Planctomycetota bacterium]